MYGRRHALRGACAHSVGRAAHHRFKAGYYGEFYDSVDPNVIMKSFHRFMEWRRDILGKAEAERTRRERKRQEQAVSAAKVTFEEYIRRRNRK